MIFTTGDVGRLLRSWRELNGLTQKAVAEKIEANELAVSMAETGTLFEAQSRMARLFFCELEHFEADQLREIDNAKKMASELTKARKWLGLTPEFVAERIGMSRGAVVFAENPGFIAAYFDYMKLMLLDLSKHPESVEVLIYQAMAPWYWKIPTERPRGSRRPDRKLVGLRAWNKVRGEKRRLRDVD